MENHPTQSKHKRNEGQRKRSLPATKSYKGPLLQRDKHGCRADTESVKHVFFCGSICGDLVKRVYITAHPYNECTVCPSCVPLYHASEYTLRMLCFVYFQFSHWQLKSPGVDDWIEQATISDKHVTIFSHLWDCFATPDLRWLSSRNFGG